MEQSTNAPKAQTVARKRKRRHSTVREQRMAEAFKRIEAAGGSELLAKYSNTRIGALANVSSWTVKKWRLSLSNPP